MGVPIEDIAKETLDEITKAQTTGILESTGAYSYDLTGIVRLIPVVTPFRDSVAREGSKNGSPFAVWRAFLNVNSSQPRATPGFDYASNEVVFAEQDFQAKYQPVGLAGLVTQDAYDLAQGLYDPYAESTFQVLNQTLIAEDKLLIGSQSYPLPQPVAPTLQVSTTLGSIGAVTLWVGVAARTGAGFYWSGNSRGNSASTAALSGSTNQVTASIPSFPKGAIALDWFYSTNAGVTVYYAGTSSTSSFVFNSYTAANAVPANSGLAGLSTAVPTYNGAADNGSGQAGLESDGLIASLTGDYNGAGQFGTAGSGTANGAQYIDNGGAAMTLGGAGSISVISTLLINLWNTVYTSPSALMMNAVTAKKIADIVLTSPSAVTYLGTDTPNRINVTAGGRVTHVVNTAAGVDVPIEVHPNVPPGVIIARTDRVPFPQSGISATLSVRTLRDYSQFEYATGRIASTVGGGPRKEFEIRSIQTLINKAPVVMGIIVNIG
jgi:hypothetical protein